MAVAVGNEPPNVIGEIGILACGRTGIGKSCLLNTLLGTSEDRFAVNGPGGVGDRCMDAGTTGLISVSEIIHGIKVTLYDTPGLESKPGDNYFIDLMEKVIEKIDLVLFCLDSTSNRWVAEAETVQKLHSRFRDKFWKNVIVVLTRANVAQPGWVDEDEQTPLLLAQKIDKCGKAVNDIFQNLKKELLKQKVPAEIVDGIPLVAAGNSKKRKLLFVNETVQDGDFVPELWSLAVERCRSQSRVFFFGVSNYKCGRFVLQDGLSLLTAEEQAEFRALFLDESLWNDSPSPTDGIPQPPPIVLTARQSNRVFKALAAATGVFGSAALGGTFSGVAVGATVWATTSLTMLAAGPVGVAVGVSVGLIGAAVLTGVLVYKYKKWKRESENVVNSHEAAAC